MAAMHHLFPWTIIKHHSATATQRELLDTAGFKPMNLADFLNQDLLPEMYSSANADDFEPLLLQALDSLALQPAACLHQPLQIFVNGRLQRVSKLVDSSSELLKDLFTRGSSYAGFELLPGMQTSTGPSASGTLNSHIA